MVGVIIFVGGCVAVLSITEVVRIGVFCTTFYRSGENGWGIVFMVRRVIVA